MTWGFRRMTLCLSLVMPESSLKFGGRVSLLGRFQKGGVFESKKEG